MCLLFLYWEYQLIYEFHHPNCEGKASSRAYFSDYVKGKANPIQTWAGPEDSRRLRLLDL